MAGVHQPALCGPEVIASGIKTASGLAVGPPFDFYGPKARAGYLQQQIYFSAVAGQVLPPHHAFAGAAGQKTVGKTAAQPQRGMRCSIGLQHLQSGQFQVGNPPSQAFAGLAQ